MLPEGRRSETFVVPLKIWSNTGTLGDEKEAPFTSNKPVLEL